MNLVNLLSWLYPISYHLMNLSTTISITSLGGNTSGEYHEHLMLQWTPKYKHDWKHSGMVTAILQSWICCLWTWFRCKKMQLFERQQVLMVWKTGRLNVQTAMTGNVMCRRDTLTMELTDVRWWLIQVDGWMWVKYLCWEASCGSTLLYFSNHEFCKPWNWWTRLYDNDW